MTNKVLVTGGAGYIGSHACKALASKGFEPITYDDLSTGNEKAVKWGPFIRGDIKDVGLLTSTLKKFKPRAILHFASSAYVAESEQNPAKYYFNNVNGSISLLMAMEKTEVKDIVFSSSCATYGLPRVERLNESTYQNPINTYGKTKLIIEGILSDFANKGRIRQVSLRYFNAAGADADGEIGEFHRPETHLIPLAIEAGLNGNLFNIYGTDFPTPDGTAVRDFVHVSDLASAHVLALDYIFSGCQSDFINLGVGTGYSVKQVVDALIGLGLRVKTQNLPRRPGDPPYLVADISKSQSTLNWAPKYTKLDEILQTALKWQKISNASF